ncbi:MAG: hypothetical protein IKH04_03150 [Kiritimatiellae bacterium]|nr:hypothetical protein [Kiritimatiellia bacterium]
MPGREYIAATCKAALAAALCIGLLPCPMVAISPLVAAALLARTWRNRIPAVGKDDVVCVPDPMRPDFRSFLVALSDAASDAAVRGTRRRFVLAPYFGMDGSVAPYGILWRPGDRTIEVAWPGGRVSRRVEADIMPLAPMPLIVAGYAAVMTIARNPRTGRVELGLESPSRLGGGVDGDGIARSAMFAYLAAVICAWRVFGVSENRNALFYFTLAAAPIFVKRLLDFLPRLCGHVQDKAAFVMRLFRRFF